jgi:hypothetical protein
MLQIVDGRKSGSTVGNGVFQESREGSSEIVVVNRGLA